MARHTHFKVQAYFQKMDDGMLVDSASLDLIANTEAEALDRAKTLVDKPHYRVAEVFEHDPDLEQPGVAVMVPANGGRRRGR